MNLIAFNRISVSVLRSPEWNKQIDPNRLISHQIFIQMESKCVHAIFRVLFISLSLPLPLPLQCCLHKLCVFRRSISRSLRMPHVPNYIERLLFEWQHDNNDENWFHSPFIAANKIEFLFFCSIYCQSSEPRARATNKFGVGNTVCDTSN